MSKSKTTNEVVYIHPNKLRLNDIGASTYCTPQNYREIRQNIEEVGVIQPILVNPNGLRVISGNLRVQIAIELGLDEVPIILTPLSDEQMDLIFISSNFQREKSLLDKYRELQLIKKLFKVVQGSRTDLNPQLKEEKKKKDELKKGLTAHEINSFNRIDKLAKMQHGDKSQKFVEEQIKLLDKKGKSLGSLINKLEKKQTRIIATPAKQKSKALTSTEAINKINKVLSQLSKEQHQEVFSFLFEEYYSKAS